MLRSFLRDSAIYTVPTLFSRGLSLLLIPLYTRVLSPADYGALDLLTLFGSIVNLTVALEVSQGLARFYSAEKDAERRVRYASTALWFTALCYAAFVSVALVFSRPLSSLVIGRAGLEAEIRIAVLNIGVGGLATLLQNQFRWELRSREYALVSLLMTFVTTAVGVWLAYGQRWGLQGFLWGLLAGSASSAILALYLLRQSFRPRFDRALLGQMLAFSVPLVPSSIAVWANNYVARLMINHYLTLDEVGVYGIGFRLVSIVSLVLVGVQVSLTPLIYTHHAEPDTPQQLARIFRMFVALALLMFVTLTVFAHEILVVMTTPAFYRGASLVVFLVPAMLLTQMYLFAPGISIAKKTHLFVWINGAGAALNVLLNWVLIPPLGIVGAALATMLAALLVFVSHMAFSQRLYPVPHEWSRLILAALCAILLAAFVPRLAVDDVTRWAVNLLAIGALAIVVLRLKLIRTEELAGALRALRR